MKKHSCTCIIPFYNEAERVIIVLAELVKITQFDSIVLVDDGSEDQGSDAVSTFIEQGGYDHIELITYANNCGKSSAIQEGLETVNTEYVFLFDADLQDIDIDEIISVIEGLYTNNDIDMGIMRRVSAHWHIKFFYRELVLAGQRMLRTEDLRKVYQTDFEKYQLELAINHYMKEKDKVVVWYPFTAKNTFKHKKMGFWKGCVKEIQMFNDIFRYQGILRYLKNSLLFPIQHRRRQKNRQIKF